MSSIRNILRRSNYSTVLIPSESEARAVPKPFSQVPGPRAIPVLGSTWKYLPLIGSWDSNRLHLVGAQMLAEFGPLVRETISSDLAICHVFRAEDIEQVYKSEGRYPSRRSHLVLENYRLNRPHIYNTGGLLPTNGAEWWRIRSAFQKNISALHDVRMFLPIASEITAEFVDKCVTDQTTIDDFLPLISRLYLELMWMYMFGKRFGSLQPEALERDSVHSKIINYAEAVNLSTRETDSTEKIWKMWKTPLYKKMEHGLQFIEKVVLGELDKIEENIEKRCNDSKDLALIEKYFLNKTIDRKDINGIAVDFLLGSVDTTSYSTSFLLHNLSKSREAQEKLRDEANQLLSAGEPVITTDILNRAVYSRAIMKESFRLNPISIGVSRYLPADTIFSGYLVPKGTLMMTQNLVACQQEENFPAATSFIPERWLRGSSLYCRSTSPFLVLPFSHGSRTCIARRLAEQNLLTLLLLVGRKFSISWRGEKLGLTTPLICKPDKPIKIKFNSWTSNQS